MISEGTVLLLVNKEQSTVDQPGSQFPCTSSGEAISFTSVSKSWKHASCYEIDFTSPPDLWNKHFALPICRRCDDVCLHSLQDMLFCDYMFFHGPLNCFAEWQTGIILDRMTRVILRVMEMQIRWIYNCTLPFVLQKWQFSIILWQPSLNRRSVTWNSQPPAVDIVYSISPVTLQAGLAKTAAREVRVRLRAGWGLKVRLRHLGG